MVAPQPRIGDWYRLSGGALFEVVAIDDSDATVDIQYFDGTAAAAVAVALAPPVREYLLAGHRSEEPGHAHLLDYIGIRPILDLRMRLGEGTGAVLAMPVVTSATHILTEMATFASAGVSTAHA